jgi:hypothetical protein
VTATLLPATLRTLANLRDVGGLRTDDGRVVRSGVLLRSDAPQIGDAGFPAPRPSTVIDLRSAEEIDVAVHPLAAVADVHHVALGESLHPERVAATPAAERDLAWAYRLIVLEATAELARIVRIVASASGPVLVHCAAGKDRTGIVVAVLLRAAGVRRDDVMADYLRTNDNLERLWARLEAAGAHLPSNSDALSGVDARVLAAALDEFERHEGGIRGHLLAHGTSPADLDTLVSRLVR